jgi:hypothetical protein
MVRKQKVEEPEKPAVISADEAIAEERQRISDEQTTEFLGEEVKNDKVVQPVEEKKVEPVIEKEPVVDEVEIDPEKMKAEIAETVKKETVDKITKALTGKEETTKEERDKYEVIAENFAKEKGRNPTWFELVKFIKDDIRQELKNETEQEKQSREELIKKNKQVEQERSKAFNTYIDEQLNELLKSGKLPKVVNKDDPNDIGVKSRKALFQTMMEVNTDRVKTGKAPIYSVKEIFYEHYKAPNTQPAGADAPISVGRGNAAVDSGEDYSYGDVHKKSFLDFFRK